MEFTYPYVDTLEKRFWKNVSKTSETGCWIWTGGKGAKGRGSISYRGRSIKSHRASWIVHFGPIPENVSITLTCKNPLCVAPHHLTIRKKAVNGEDQWASKLTAEMVREIKRSNETQAVLAQRYGVTGGAISQILTGRTWKHVA